MRKSQYQGQPSFCCRVGIGAWCVSNSMPEGSIWSWIGAQATMLCSASFYYGWGVKRESPFQSVSRDPSCRPRVYGRTGGFSSSQDKYSIDVRFSFQAQFNSTVCDSHFVSL